MDREINVKQANRSKHKKSGHDKTKHNKSRTSEEKSERFERDRRELNVANKSHDLPAVQCKDTLLLDYDHKAQYSKRKLESNADRYKELPNVDDDGANDENGQLSAADFQQLLSRPASTGDHFTFAAERSWLQSTDTDTSNDDSMLSNLFKLNISNLNDGLMRIPFYLRHNLPSNNFTEEELTKMHDQNQCFKHVMQQCPKSNVSEPVSGQKANKKLKNRNELPTNVNDESLAKMELVKLLQHTKICEPSKSVASIEPTTTQIVTPMPPPAKTSALSQTTQVKPTSSSSSNQNQPKSENIQDWLDDILNE